MDLLIKKLLNLKKLNLISEISLTIRGTNDQLVLNNNGNILKPSELIINDVVQDYTGYYAYNLTNEENNITLKWDTSLSDCLEMFYARTNIIRLDLSKFDSSAVTTMKNMFYDCNSLLSLNLTNFKTTLVKDMGGMFYNCKLLTSLDLSNFDTSLVTNMEKMFAFCVSLESLDLNNFITSLVTDMGNMFESNKKLISLELNNFDTSIVTNMLKMFYECTSLISLNISHFTTSSSINKENMFMLCNNDLMYCINEVKNSDIITELSLANSNYKNNCSDICFSELKRLKYYDNNIIKCHIDCIYNDILKFEYNDTCYISCPKGTHNSTENNYICEKDEIESNTLNNELSEYESTTLSNEFTEYESTTLNNEFTEYESTTLNNESTEYESTILNNEFSEDYTISNYIEKNSLSNYETSELTQKSYSNIFLNILNEINNKKNQDDMLKYIRNQIIIGALDEVIKDNIYKDKKDILIKKDNVLFQITSTYNQYNNEYVNISNIQLKECEDKLINDYHMNKSESILILKMDYFEEGLKIPIIDYELYNNLTKQKLDLLICQNEKVSISIPVQIDEENIFKYNIYNDYYNDICVPYTTESKTDIILADRRNEFIYNNLSLCEADCEYNGYNIETKKSICECKIKNEIPLISEIINNKDKIFQNFMDLTETTNIYTMKCTNLLFSLEGLKMNIGSYILLVIILLYIVLSVYFLIKGFSVLKNMIDKFIKLITINKNIKPKKYSKDKRNKTIKINSKKKEFNEVIFKKKDKSISKSRTMIKNNPSKKTKKIIQKNNIYIMNLKNDFYGKSDYIKLNNKNKGIIERNENKINKKQNILLNYNDYEINDLKYKDAFKNDKRNFFDYYTSLIKRKQILIFTFYTNDDYNSKAIKISLFLFIFTVYYVVNALFFNDSTMHKILEDEGSYNITYQIPQIIYSFLISNIIKTVVTWLSLSEKYILKLRKVKENIKKEKKKLIKCLITKFTFFFFTSFIFLIIFWFYLSSFCAVYKNTQIHLIEDTLISFLLSLLIPFGLCLIPGIFRIPSLNRSKYNKEWLYNLSKLIQIII